MVAPHLVEKLRRAELEMPDWALTPSAALVADFESRMNLSLPDDYRVFLAQFAGCTLTATVPFLEMTPCGDSAVIGRFFGFMPPGRQSGDLRYNTELIEGAPDVIALGKSDMNFMWWMLCSGEHAGRVYLHDYEQRSGWSDEFFRERFPKLSPQIEQYLSLRR